MRLAVVTILMMVLAFVLNAAAFEKTAQHRNIEVVMRADKPLVVGSNAMLFHLSERGKALEDAAVTVKIFMPSMPGMPYMEQVVEAVKAGEGDYKAVLNFSMGGTWQLHLFVNKADKSKIRIKSSLSL